MKKTFIFTFSLIIVTLLILPGNSMAVSMDEFRLNGFFDIEYEKSYSDSKSLGDTNGSFDQVHFNLLMEFPVSDPLTVKGHIEYEHGPHLPDHGELNVEWAYLEYLVSNTMKVRGGTVLTPFGIYNEIHDATPTYVSIRVPFGIYKTNKVGGFSMFPKFSTGFTLLGNYFSEGDLHLNYVLYIANGENDIAHEMETDENSNKAIGGRIMVSPIEGVTVGGSYFTGKKGTNKKDHSTWAGSVNYNHYPLNVRAEYASSRLDNQTEKGWYGEVSYRINMITPFVRYGTLDPNDSVNNDEWTELVYGINYEIRPNFVWKIENRQFGGNPNNTKVPDDYNEIAVSLTVAF